MEKFPSLGTFTKPIKGVGLIVLWINRHEFSRALAPRFAQMCSMKYGTTNASEAQRDLAKNHARKVSRCFLQDIAQAVAEVAQSKEERWSYTQPLLDGEASHAAVSIDGTCMVFCQDGWRSAMVGTISLYDLWGERLYTTYVASAPEYGKAAFLKKMEPHTFKVPVGGSGRFRRMRGTEPQNDLGLTFTVGESYAPMLTPNTAERCHTKRRSC